MAGSPGPLPGSSQVAETTQKIVRKIDLALVLWHTNGTEPESVWHGEGRFR